MLFRTLPPDVALHGKEVSQGRRQRAEGPEVSELSEKYSPKSAELIYFNREECHHTRTPAVQDFSNVYINNLLEFRMFAYMFFALKMANKKLSRSQRICFRLP